MENGATLTGYDIVLRRLGTISGTVTGSSRPVANATVTVMSVDGGFSYSATTGADGRYTVVGVKSGGYKVRFNDVAATGLLGEYWKDVAAFEQATTVTVTDGGAVTGINADLLPAGTVSGTVRTAAGLGRRDLRFISGRIGTTSLVTDSAGRYTHARAPRLRHGDVRLAESCPIGPVIHGGVRDGRSSSASSSM